MGPRTVFRICFGFNLHFTQQNYSVIKYGTDTKAANAKYDSMSEGQKFRYIYLAEKYVSNMDLTYAIIGAQFSGVSLQFDPKPEIQDAYIKFKARRESLTYVLTSEIKKYNDLENKSLDKVIFKYFVGEFSPELILLLEKEDELNLLYNNSNLIWARDKILRLIKYKDFFSTKKYSHLLTSN